MGSQEVIQIEEDFTLIRFQNDGETNFYAQHEVSHGLIPCPIVSREIGSRAFCYSLVKLVFLLYTLIVR